MTLGHMSISDLIGSNSRTSSLSLMYDRPACLCSFTSVTSLFHGMASDGTLVTLWYSDVWMHTLAFISIWSSNKWKMESLVPIMKLDFVGFHFDHFVHCFCCGYGL